MVLRRARFTCAILLAVEKLERFRGSVQIFVRSKFLTTRGTGSHLKAF